MLKKRLVFYRMAGADTTPAGRMVSNGIAYIPLASIWHADMARE